MDREDLPRIRGESPLRRTGTEKTLSAWMMAWMEAWLSMPALAKRMGARERLCALKRSKTWGLGEEEWRLIPT